MPRRVPSPGEIRRFSADQLAALTPRELQVIQRITQPYEQIADEFGLSARTVKVHAIRAMGKLGRINRYEACAAAALTFANKK